MKLALAHWKNSAVPSQCVCPSCYFGVIFFLIIQYNACGHWPNLLPQSTVGDIKVFKILCLPQNFFAFSLECINKQYPRRSCDLIQKRHNQSVKKIQKRENLTEESGRLRGWDSIWIEPLKDGRIFANTDGLDSIRGLVTEWLREITMGHLYQISGV